MQASAAISAKESDSAIAALSQEELAACAQILALGIAQHRMKFGVIPLEAPPATDSAGAARLRDAVRSSFDEALRLVRQKQTAQAQQAQRAARDAAQAEDEAQAAIREQRRQLRISVSAAVELGLVDSGDTCKATLRNISWGGASVRCQDMVLHAGQRVRLHLPIGKNDRIATIATVLRTTTVNGASEYGLRFDSMTSADEERLEKVLDILVANPSPDARRSEARLVQRLEIEYGDSGEFCAVLEDISPSGVMLTVPDPLEIDQSLLVTLSGADTHHSLSLRARVVHQTLVSECGIDMYRVGLRFEHPGDELRARVAAVLQHLAVLRPAANPDEFLAEAG
ncbi:MAG: PilZ domain-containing protein [Proteobacteria bacterium]|nr:PilZ domain-containing protein [Pseudomonadota bacterium]